MNIMNNSIKPKYEDPRSQYHYLRFKFLYLAYIVLVAIFWNEFLNLSKFAFSHLTILWIIFLLRNQNKYNSSIQFQFAMSFWMRLGWGICYSLYNTGKIYTNRHDFAIALVEYFIFSLVYTMLPLGWIQKIWSNKTFRWCIFVLNQSTANGINFGSIFQKQFLTKHHSTILQPILVLSSKAISRPGPIILSMVWKNTLTRQNLRIWGTNLFYNIYRSLFLAALNYIFFKYAQNDEHSKSIIEYFNVCYFSFVGYLMYLQTYSLRKTVSKQNNHKKQI